ncbi:21002_t:CDS:2 [Entrophospora sp. SA101]|nr:21002_t:CDS:2 [Entrophospora sp. SA101]
MRKTIAKAKLENKEGEFECSFGKNLLENYSEAKKVCFLKCLAGAQEENSKTLIVQKEKEDEIKELNEKQKIVCQLALTGQNVCFLGEAGTGKSFLLKHLIKLLSEEYEEELVITSYTVHLNQIYRQQDNKIINLLQEVRAGNLSAAKVNQINQQELAKLATSSITYCARDKEKRAHTLTGLRITEAIGFNPELKHPEPEYQDLYLLRGKRKKDQFLRRVRYDLNINSHIELAPHTLRRCFATYNLLAGMPLNILQKFLGHSRVSTTALYIKDSDLANLLKFKPI